MSRVLLISLIFSFLGLALASHFRYGNIHWERVGTSRTVRFFITTAWRENVFGGSTFSEPSVNFGDSTTVRPIFRVISRDTSDSSNSQHFLVAQVGTAAAPYIERTYNSDGPFTVTMSSCCRISTLVNSRDQPWTVTTRVDLRDPSQTRSPVSTLLPVIDVPLVSASDPVPTFQIPAAASNSNSFLRFITATVSQLGGAGNVQPVGLTVSSSGLVSFPTAGKAENQLYTTQIIIEEYLNSAPNTLRSYVAVDFLIRIRRCLNLPSFAASGAVCDSPTPLDAFVGIPFSLFVSAASTATPGSPVVISGVIPPDATVSPYASLPAVGNPGTTSTSFTFQWTPDRAGNVILNFAARDACGLNRPCSFTLNVIDCPPLTLSSSGPTTFCHGGSVVLTASSLGAGTTYTWSHNSAVTSNQITVTTSGTFTVTARRDSCVRTASVTVTVNPLPIALVRATLPKVYRGWPAKECTWLTCSSGRPQDQVSLLWNTRDTIPHIRVCPRDQTTYSCVLTNTVTRCVSAPATIKIGVKDVRCGGKLNKIKICRKRKYGKGKTICVSDCAVPYYLSKKCKYSLGACSKRTK